MNTRLRLLVAGAAALAGSLAQAEPHLRPGLWEEAVTVKSDNAQANAAMEQMKARMAAMPPDQREAMEKMMASHGIGMAAGAPNTVRICVTKEQADRGFKPEDNGHCTRSNVRTSGSTTSFDFACKSEHSSVTGQGSFTAQGDSAFTAATTADNVSPKMAMHIQSEIAGRFVSADCGDVKPMQTSPAK